MSLATTSVNARRLTSIGGRRNVTFMSRIHNSVSPYEQLLQNRIYTNIFSNHCGAYPHLGGVIQINRDLSSASSNVTPMNNQQNQATGDNSHEELLADHSWRQLNHIWTDDEIKERMASKDKKHAPVTISDKVMSNVMKGMYWSFNTISGYRHENPTAKSIEWRLIILESFAGVPGFLAAAFRHFYSLRSLKRDHGSIYTFLEEAENERMHLLVCLKMFRANTVTKALVVAAQLSMTPLLMLTYMVSPAAMHRFVGYLEETAVHTYSNIIQHCETEGTNLHREWAHLEAPGIAKKYWALSDDAKWVTCLKHMLADEAQHRDVNHTFATLPPGSENPFIEGHMKNFDFAAMRRTESLLRKVMSDQALHSAKISNKVSSF